uniref:NADH dehydrogenase subunit 6 n=1 Tax=Micrura ignea TaxID=328822 RepID=A0A0D5NSX7_9BILA|nr:NADH dehydrogenase subunit 6 [Micrura ignea]AJY78580.1 NADH dehydrogenase subunit 6 [Micrura ignea]
MSVYLSTGFVYGLVFLLPLMQQPIGLGFVILLMAGVISWVLGVVGLVWYGFSLFLIYVGGLLVMFGYVVVLVPNFVFSAGKSVYLVLLGVGIGSGFLVGGNSGSVVEGGVDLGLYLFSDFGLFVVLGLGLVLFLALVCVVKVCYFHSGSLRPFVFS